MEAVESGQNSHLFGKLTLTLTLTLTLNPNLNPFTGKQKTSRKQCTSKPKRTPLESTHANESTAMRVLYGQREQSIDDLEADLATLRIEEIVTKVVTAFMEELQLFYTTTELGKGHLGLLLYPPSAALKADQLLEMQRAEN
jgi:hypothetical protein